MVLTCANTGRAYTGTLDPRQWPRQSSFPLSNNSVSPWEMPVNLNRLENYEKGRYTVRERLCGNFSRLQWFHCPGWRCPCEDGEWIQWNAYCALDCVKMRCYLHVTVCENFGFVLLVSCEGVIGQRCACTMTNTLPDHFESVHDENQRAVTPRVRLASEAEECAHGWLIRSHHAQICVRSMTTWLRKELLGFRKLATKTLHKSHWN